ncbi:MAG: hypothetical protein RLN62_05660 [Rickettsiales bacterium]
MKKNLNNKLSTLVDTVSEHSRHDINVVYFKDSNEYLAFNRNKQIINPITKNNCDFIQHFNADDHNNFICVTHEVQFSSSIELFTTCSSLALISRFIELSSCMTYSLYSFCGALSMALPIYEAFHQGDVIEVNDIRYNFEQLPSSHSVDEVQKLFNYNTGVFPLENSDILIA